jgi:hypothetical protein
MVLGPLLRGSRRSDQPLQPTVTAMERRFVVVKNAGRDDQCVVKRGFRCFTTAWAWVERHYTSETRARQLIDVMRVATDGSLTTEY